MHTLQVNISRIPRNKNAKFSGYYFYMNTNILGDFQICIGVPFKAHARALDINQNKWRDILPCCTQSTAFTFFATKIPEDEVITYNTLKIEMKKRFFGDDYRRILQQIS